MRQKRGPALAVLVIAAVAVAIGCGKEDPASVVGTVALNVEDDDPSGVLARIGDNRTETEADGSFELTGVVPGERILRAAREGYEPEERTVSLAPGERKDVGTIELRRENAEPRVRDVSAMPPEIEPGETATVEVTASDPDGDALSYIWEAPTDRWTVASTEEPTRAELTAPDEHGVSGTVAVTVEDGFGGAVTNELLVSTTVE